MSSEASRRFAGLALTLILISLPLDRSWAQPLTLDGPITQHALESTGDAMRARQSRQRPSCNVTRRMLTGATVGFLVGMVAVRKAAEANDGVAGAKTTIHGGGYGAALGAVIGLATCRP